MNADNQYCYLCGSNDFITRPGSVRDNAKISVLECRDCGLVFLSSFNHIEIDHYEKSGMHDGDCQDITQWLCESESDDIRRYNYLKTIITDNTLLDFGCGPGGFLDLTKKVSKNVYGVEIEERLHLEYKKRNLNVFRNLQEASESGLKWKVITMFHVLEHISDPIGILNSLSLLLSENGEIIIEVPNSNDALLTLYGNREFQNFTYWSNHLYTFNARTLKDLVQKTGLRVNWIKHIQRYPLSNHFYWLINGEPGGHKLMDFLNGEKLNKEYEAGLAAVSATDTIIMSVSI